MAFQSSLRYHSRSPRGIQTRLCAMDGRWLVRRSTSTSTTSPNHHLCLHNLAAHVRESQPLKTRSHNLPCRAGRPSSIHHQEHLIQRSKRKMQTSQPATTRNHRISIRHTTDQSMYRTRCRSDKLRRHDCSRTIINKNDAASRL